MKKLGWPGFEKTSISLLDEVRIKIFYKFILVLRIHRVAKTFLNKSVQKSVHFQKKSVQSVQFSKNNPYNLF